MCPSFGNVDRERSWTPGLKTSCFSSRFRDLLSPVSIGIAGSIEMAESFESSDSRNGDSYATKPLSLAIIGGGIGGLSLLLGLLQYSNVSVIKAHLYEAAAEFSEIGAGVGFGPNSIQAMGVVSPSLQKRFEEIASDSDEVIDENGKKRAVWNFMLMGMNGRSERCPLKAGDPICKVLFDTFKKNVHRARFLDEIINQLPGGTGEGFVSFKKRCTDLVKLNDGKGVGIQFSDGTYVEADAVVGCDGIKSRIRPILMKMIGDEKSINPQFSGKYAYRGLIPMDEAVDALGDTIRHSSMYFGYSGHFVCFPVDKGKTLNVVAFRTKEDGKWESADWILPATVDEALEDYKEWSEPIKKMVKSLRKPDKWMLFEHPPAESYCDEDGKICLLGDCAHAR